MSDSNIDPDITPVDPASPEAEQNAPDDTTTPGGQTLGGQAASGGAPTGETLGGERPDASNTASKDPEQWVTGDEPITGPQKSYLDTLAREAGEELPADMTKAEASEHIDRLQQKTGRGA
jgi:hypothetical protein